MGRASPREKLKRTGVICGAEEVLSPFLAALQLSNAAGHSIPPKQPMNVVVAPTANQLIAMLASNPSTRTWNVVTAICAFLIVAGPWSHNDTEAISQLSTAQGICRYR